MSSLDIRINTKIQPNETVTLRTRRTRGLYERSISLIDDDCFGNLAVVSTKFVLVWLRGHQREYCSFSIWSIKADNWCKLCALQMRKRRTDTYRASSKGEKRRRQTEATWWAEQNEDRQQVRDTPQEVHGYDFVNLLQGVPNGESMRDGHLGC